MAADHGTAAPVSGERHQLRKEGGGEDAGVAPHAAVAQGRDALRPQAPLFRQRQDALPPQKGLVRHLEQHAVAVPQGREPQVDGVAEALLGLIVEDGRKVEICRQAHDLRVLGYHHGLVEGLRRHGLQAPQDQLAAPQLGGQLVGSEARGAAGGHDHAAQFQPLLHRVPHLAGVSISAFARPSQRPG